MLDEKILQLVAKGYTIVIKPDKHSSKAQVEFWQPQDQPGSKEGVADVVMFDSLENTLDLLLKNA